MKLIRALRAASPLLPLSVSPLAAQETPALSWAYQVSAPGTTPLPRKGEQAEQMVASVENLSINDMIALAA